MSGIRLVRRCEDFLRIVCRRHVSRFKARHSGEKNSSRLTEGEKKIKKSTSGLKMLPLACGLGQYFQDVGHSFSPSDFPYKLNETLIKQE